MPLRCTKKRRWHSHEKLHSSDPQKARWDAGGFGSLGAGGWLLENAKIRSEILQKVADN